LTRRKLRDDATESIHEAGLSVSWFAWHLGGAKERSERLAEIVSRAEGW
jgi:hypothetical protein